MKVKQKLALLLTASLITVLVTSSPCFSLITPENYIRIIYDSRTGEIVGEYYYWGVGGGSFIPELAPIFFENPAATILDPLAIEENAKQMGFGVIRADNSPFADNLVHGWGDYIVDLKTLEIREKTKAEKEESEKLYEALPGTPTMTSRMVYPDNKIRVTAIYNGYTIEAESTSSIFGLTVEGNKIHVKVGGEKGTLGMFELRIPTGAVPSPNGINVMLDNQSIEYTINQMGGYYYVYGEYSHSIHVLTISFGIEEESEFFVWVAAVGIAITIVIGTLYFYRFRR